MPVIRSRDELRNLLIQAPLEWLTMPASDQGVARRVRTALLPRNGQAVEFPNLDEVAEQFNMTPQTLRRRLKDESTSYRTIKENIRRDIAIKKVLLGASAIEDIAYLVGYSETRAFTRAFHQWTGLSPMQYRQKFYRPLEA
jgi:AraC-like DNA-binding protein